MFVRIDSCSRWGFHSKEQQPNKEITANVNSIYRNSDYNRTFEGVRSC